MLDPTPSTSDSTTPPSESQELNITKLFYLHLRKNVVDIGNFDNDLNKILESYNSSTSSAPSTLSTDVKSTNSSSPSTLPTDKKSASLKVVLEKIKENNKPKTSEEINEAIEETPQQIKEAIKETLRLYKEYFSIKLSSDGNPDNHDDETKNILNNFTKDDEGSLVKSIYNSVNDDHNLELQASLKRYLGGLLVKAESKNSDTIEDQKDNIEEIKNILAIFPGGYKIVDQKVVTDIDFICIAGSKERVDNAFFALNDSSPEVRAIKSVIDKFAAQLAPKVRQGLQIHTAPCIELSLAIARNDIKDPSAISPQQFITSREMLAFSYNLNKMIEKEFKVSKERLAEDYERLFKKIEEISQEGWEDPDQKENKLLTPQEKKQGTILKKINIFIEQVNNSGFNIESVAGILKDDCDSANITTASLIPLEKLKEKYPIKVPTGKFQKELSAVTADRLPKHDHLKYSLNPDDLFKDNSESGNESLRLDVKKIKNLIDLFPTKEANAEAETLGEVQKSKMLAGLVTLRNILDGYKTSDNNYFYFLKFNKKFEEKTGKSFEDFFYKNINAPLVDGSPEVKEEFQHAKPILDTIASRINAKRISFGREKEDVSLLIQSLVLAEEKEDKIKKLFTETRDILELKNSSGENIAKILYQFSEEVLLTALEAKPELLEKIIEKNNQPSPFPPISLLQIITHENDKELLLNILKKYQEAHQKEGDADGKKALGEMIFQQNLLLHIVGENKVDLLEAIIPMLNIDDLNKADKDEKTPLYFACFKGHTDIVEALIAERPDGKIVDLNKANNNGATPLLAACANGHTDVVKALIEKKEVNLNLVNKEGLTPLAVAYLYGRIDIVKYLIEKEGVELDCPNKDGVTPLVIACANGHTDVVKALIKKEGVNLNHADKYGLTPLALACKHGRIDIVKALIKKGGVDLNPGNSKEAKPLYFACRNGNIHIAKALFEAGANVDCLKKERRLYGYNDVIDKKLIYNKSEGIKKLIKTFIDPKEIEKRDERLKNINKPHSDATSPSAVVSKRQAGVVAGGRVPSGRAPS